MTTNTLYLPIIATSDPLVCFGAQIEGDPALVVNWIVPKRIYQIAARWDGHDQQRLDRYVKVIRDAGGDVAFGVKIIPQQYRLWPDYVGSPIDPRHYAALLNFLCGLAIRYRPRWIEAFNEPNVPRDQCKADGHLYGAWQIDGEDPYIGGQRYGNMLRAIYPALSQYTTVYGGALAYGENITGFLAGIGDANMDCLSWHCYIGLGAPNIVLDTRIIKIAEALNLPQAITETNVKADSNSPELQERKASWFSALVDAVKTAKIKTVGWYTLHGNDWPAAGCDLAPGLAWEKFRGEKV